LKPGISGLDASADNEHFCLVLARSLGLPVAHSEIAEIEGERAIVVERYDRAWVGPTLRRVHQEDMCQALCVSPALKYQSEGGPSPARIVELLRAVSAKPEEDLRTFARALLFNWLIGGTDAHAKNYSLLLGAGARVRLAPLYDVASALPYKEIPFQKLKLAMKVGGKYRLRDIARGEWQALAHEARLPFEQLLEDGRAMAQALPDASSDISAEIAQDGLSGPVLERLHDALVARARRCLNLLGA
jgi:serine/threonine-protein kinase HipA